jgi:hypothetical protein
MVSPTERAFSVLHLLTSGNYPAAAGADPGSDPIIASTPGRVPFSRSTPVVVTRVRLTQIHSRFCKPPNATNPASVICVRGVDRP